jgi:hypothetical protein
LWQCEIGVSGGESHKEVLLVVDRRKSSPFWRQWDLHYASTGWLYCHEDRLQVVLSPHTILNENHRVMKSYGAVGSTDVSHLFY